MLELDLAKMGKVAWGNVVQVPSAKSKWLQDPLLGTEVSWPAQDAFGVPAKNLSGLCKGIPAMNMGLLAELDHLLPDPNSRDINLSWRKSAFSRFQQPIEFQQPSHIQ